MSGILLRKNGTRYAYGKFYIGYKPAEINRHGETIPVKFFNLDLCKETSVAW
jgi:hypothetical protein